MPSFAVAEDWQINPTASLTEHFSDNINLSPSSERQSAFVTDISPGISISGLGARYNLNLDYRMQNLLYEGGGRVNRTHQYFQTNSTSELIRNSVFLNMRSTHGQLNSSSSVGNIASDNISGSSSNRTDVTTFSINPYWTPYLGGYAEGKLSFSYETFSSDNSSSSDTQSHVENINLRSGTRFNKVTWYFNFNNDYTHRDGGSSVQFRNYEGELRFHFNREYAVFIRSGRFDNQYASNTNSNANGTYKALGFGWNPSRKTYLEILSGDEMTQFSLRYNPSQRTSLSLTWNDHDVGTNVGKTWNVSFSKSTRRTTWTFDYYEDTTTSQRTFSEVDYFTSVFGDTGLTDQQIMDYLNEQNISLPTLQDEVYRRRQWKFGLSGRVTSKTNYNLKAYQEKRTYQVSESDQEVQGISGNFRWKFAKRTYATIEGTWQETDQISQDRLDKRYSTSFGLERQLGDNGDFFLDSLTAGVQVRHLKQTSDESSAEYEENRISATIRAIF